MSFHPQDSTHDLQVHSQTSTEQLPTQNQQEADTMTRAEIPLKSIRISVDRGGTFADCYA